MTAASTLQPVVPVQPQRSRRGEPAWEIAMLFPVQGDWTEADYLALDTNHLIELSEGCLEVLPMPNRFHQRIVKFLLYLLETYLAAHRLGEILPAPLPVRLWSAKFRQPDLVFCRNERIGDPRKHAEGADLAMEVISEGKENRERDLQTKRAEYAKAGIQEYWIVDPEEQRIIVLTLDGQEYRVHGEFRPGTQATSLLLPGFSVDVSAVFAAGQRPEAPQASSNAL